MYPPINKHLCSDLIRPYRLIIFIFTLKRNPYLGHPLPGYTKKSPYFYRMEILVIAIIFWPDQFDLIDRPYYIFGNAYLVPSGHR